MGELHTDTLSWARKHLAEVEANLKEVGDSAVMPDVAAIRVVLDALEAAEREVRRAREEADTAAGRWSDALEAAKRERDEARAEAGRLREALEAGLLAQFPIIPDRHRDSTVAPHPMKVPWSIAELAYSIYVRHGGGDQSLERLAERGGFGASEMDMFLPDWRERAAALGPPRG